jgi:hypothetical protein
MVGYERSARYCYGKGAKSKFHVQQGNAAQLP